MNDVLWRKFEALFPMLTATVGRESAKNLAASYFRAFPQNEWEPNELFRSLPAFVRNETRLGKLPESYLTDLVLWEWSRFSVLYSPADENRERRSIKSGMRMLNPTTEIMRFETDIVTWLEGERSAKPKHAKAMIFMWRARKAEADEFIVSHLQAEPITAAILDCFLEEGRLNDSELLTDLRAHHGEGDWRQAIERLTRLRLLLNA